MRAASKNKGAVALVVLVALCFVGLKIALAQSDPPIPSVACVNNEVHLIWRDYQFKVIITGITCQHTGDIKWQTVRK
jgi:hypothetical protein